MDPWVTPALMAGGAIASGLSGVLGHRGKWGQQATKSPEQLAGNRFARTQGMAQIQNPYQGFQPIANNAIGQFNRQVVPSLAERFSSLGNNSLSSPAFGSQMQGASDDLQERLAAMQAQYGLQQQDLGQRLFGMGQSPEFENVYTAGGDNWLSSILGNLGQGMGSVGMMGAKQQYGGGQQNDQLIRQLIQALRG
jgi:hypothetical protein